MPSRLCLAPRCPNPPTYRGRCDLHRREPRRKGKQVYNSKRWKILRRSVLYAFPLCQHPGCEQIATDVDHITPLAQGGKPYDRANLQALCATHHAQKTKAEMA